MRFLVKLLNAPFAAVNYLFTGKTGHEPVLTREFLAAWDRADLARRFLDELMRQLRQPGFNAAARTHVGGKLNRNATCYARIVARERGEPFVP